MRVKDLVGLCRVTGERSTLAFVLVVLLLSAGGAAVASGQTIGQPAAKSSVDVRKIEPPELKKLRWVEGTWRVTATNMPPHLERYHFADDVTLLVDTFAGEDLSQVHQTVRYGWANGYFQNLDGGTPLVASDLTAESISFVPLYGNRTTYKWMRRSPDQWDNIVNRSASSTDGPAGVQVYHLERWSAPNSGPLQN